MSMNQRVDKLEAVWRRTDPTDGAGFDLNRLHRLTLREQFELSELLKPLEGLPLHPNGRPDYGPLSDDQLERFYELTQKLEGPEGQDGH